MRYVVTAGYVTVETAVGGHRASIDIGRGSILPDDVRAEDLERVISLGQVARIEANPGPDPEVIPAETADPAGGGEDGRPARNTRRPRRPPATRR